MNAIIDLEFTIHRHEQNSYAVDFRFSQPESEAKLRSRAQAVCPAGQ